MKKRTVFVAGLTAALCLVSLGAGVASAQETQIPKVVIPVRYKQAVATFEERVKAYAKMREGLEEKLPQLPKDATPEQIQAHKTSFQDMVRTARRGAKQGDVFSASAAQYFRTTIKSGFTPQELKELRATMLEADTRGVPLRVNYPYPESKEQVDIPPNLLLKLPQLPKQVRYRFVGRHMLLVDRENGLIVDYMTNALP